MKTLTLETRSGLSEHHAITLLELETLEFKEGLGDHGTIIRVHPTKTLFDPPNHIARNRIEYEYTKINQP